MSDPRERITGILRNLDPANPAQAGELFAAVYDELRELADRQLRHERPGHTLQTTALVHEAYLKLLDSQPLDLQSRAHFFGIVARAMRQVLVDHARRRQALKRGGELQRVTLDTSIADSDAPATDVLDLHTALEKLSVHDDSLAQLVELRFFAGRTLDEAADLLGVSRRKAAKDWSVARLWLRRELEGGA